MHNFRNINIKKWLESPVNLVSAVSLAIIAFCLQTYAQDFRWVNTMGSTANDAGETIAQDSDGNIYVGGYFRAVIDFDTSPDSMYLASSGGIDCFIQKLTPEGSLLWAKRMGGIDADDCKSIAIDSSGNVYSTGYFMDTVDSLTKIIKELVAESN